MRRALLMLGCFAMGAVAVRAWQALQPSAAPAAPAVATQAPPAVAPSSDCADAQPSDGPQLRVDIACEGLRCRLDAGATVAPAGVHSFRWDLGGGVTASNAAINHEFPAPGRHEVAVAAVDRCGGMDYEVLAVEVPGRGGSPASGRPAATRAPAPSPRPQRFSGGTTQPSPAAEDEPPANDDPPIK